MNVCVTPSQTASNIWHPHKDLPVHPWLTVVSLAPVGHQLLSSAARWRAGRRADMGGDLGRAGPCSVFVTTLHGTEAAGALASADLRARQQIEILEIEKLPL